jgi:hypothetical protein
MMEIHPVPTQRAMRLQPVDLLILRENSLVKVDKYPDKKEDLFSPRHSEPASWLGKPALNGIVL